MVVVVGKTVATIPNAGIPVVVVVIMFSIRRHISERCGEQQDVHVCIRQGFKLSQR